ncbi:hypothetical protein [Rhodoferax sp. GW822-FHT02A01]
MKSQIGSVNSIYSLPSQNFSFLVELFEAMPIVIFFKAVQDALKAAR